jgi:hypothetical protein
MHSTVGLFILLLVRYSLLYNPRLSNAALLREMGHLKQQLPSQHDLNNAILLLEHLDFEALRDDERLQVFVPDSNSHLQPLVDVYYNDLGDRACLLEIPSDKFLAHSKVQRDLAKALRMETLISLDLKNTEDDEDMGEKLTDRVRTLLLQYNIEHAFNEFLANASDAHATSFDILVDESPPSASANLLSAEMAHLQPCPAVIIHNDATFTAKDFSGILRVGTGGKSDKTDTIGQFGLGSLVMFHFTEVRLN